VVPPDDVSEPCTLTPFDRCRPPAGPDTSGLGVRAGRDGHPSFLDARDRTVCLDPATDAGQMP